jgi:hypothetical protein
MATAAALSQLGALRFVVSTEGTDNASPCASWTPGFLSRRRAACMYLKGDVGGCQGTHKRMSNVERRRALQLPVRF